MTAEYRFLVALPACYLPADARPRLSEVAEVVRVRAASRTEAARLAWQVHGQRWLTVMQPCQARWRRVRLFVGRQSRELTRLAPVTVL